MNHQSAQILSQALERYRDALLQAAAIADHAINLLKFEGVNVICPTQQQRLADWRSLLLMAKARGDEEQAGWIADRILDQILNRETKS